MAFFLYAENSLSSRARKSGRKKKSTNFTHRGGFVYYYIAINHIFSCLLKL